MVLNCEEGFNTCFSKSQILGNQWINVTKSSMVKRMDSPIGIHRIFFLDYGRIFLEISKIGQESHIPEKCLQEFSDLWKKVDQVRKDILIIEQEIGKQEKIVHEKREKEQKRLKYLREQCIILEEKCKKEKKLFAQLTSQMGQEDREIRTLTNKHYMIIAGDVFMSILGVIGSVLPFVKK